MISRMRWFRRYPTLREYLAWSVIRTWEIVVISKLTNKAALARFIILQFLRRS
jgi:hypothetical protein